MHVIDHLTLHHYITKAIPIKYNNTDTPINKLCHSDIEDEFHFCQCTRHQM